jgi:hypothetical protein
MANRAFIKEHFVLILGIALPLALIVIFSLARVVTEAAVSPPQYKAVYAQPEDYPQGKFNYQVAQNGSLVVTYTGPQPYAGQKPQPPVPVRINTIVFDPVTGAQNKYPLEVADSMKPGIVAVPTDKLPPLNIIAGVVAPDGYTYILDSQNYNGGVFADLFGYGRYYGNRHVISKKGKVYLLPLDERFSRLDFIGWVK